MFCLGKLWLTPFPKIVDQNPYWTEFLKNFIKWNDFSNIDDNLYENLPTKMQLLHDFLKEDESDIFIWNWEERKLRVCFIRRWVIHNQLEFTLTSEELEMILFNKNDPFSELS